MPPATSSTSPPDGKVEAGQAVYSRLVLALYDFWVLGVSNRFIWQCPTPLLLSRFNRYVSTNHLDVGVGTGYFLDKCTFPGGTVRLGLLDLNRNSLDVAASRLERYVPLRIRHNVLEPLDNRPEPFDSISLNYLFHCLPGALPEKLIVLDYLAPLLSEGGHLFGATILQGGVKPGAAARLLMGLYNSRGIFDNTRDTLRDLERGLSARYTTYSIEVSGCVAMFHARP